MATASDKERVRALERGLSVLTFLRDHSPSSLTEIAYALVMDKSTVLRLLNSLVELGFAEVDADHRHYRLGLECVTLGRRVTSDLALRRAAFSHMELLQQLSGQSVTLAVLHRRMALPVEKLYGQTPDRVRSQWGVHPLCLHSTALGKAMLAQMPDAELCSIYETIGFPRHTDSTLTTLEAVRAELSLTRERGYAVDNSENMAGLCCIGAAIFGKDDVVVGALSISFAGSRFTEAAYLPLVPALRKACMDISETIGAGDRALIKLAL
jgi:DNA-binding IclR family transcriptional regulator